MTLTEELDLAIKFLSSKANIRKIFDEFQYDEIEKLMKRIDDVNSEFVEKRAKAEAELAERKEKLNEAKKLLSDLNITVEDLLDEVTSVSKPERKKREVVKFNFKFAENDIRELALTGRVANDIQEIIEMSEDKSEKWQFIIEADRRQYIDYLERTGTKKNKEQANIAREYFGIY